MRAQVIRTTPEKASALGATARLRLRGGGCNSSKGQDVQFTSIEKAAAVNSIDLDRYTKPTSIWVALLTGHVRLVKSSWLIAYSKAKGILPRRQELPKDAFISVDELKSMYGEGNKDGVLPMIAISFCWLTPPHPDPRGEQLALVAGVLEREQKKYNQENESFKGFPEMGVFWDWVGGCVCVSHLAPMMIHYRMLMS